MASAPFSSPPPRAVGGKRDIYWSGDCTSWAASALAKAAPDSSPVAALNSIRMVVDELTRSSERLTHRAGLALATAGHFKEWLDVEDAKTTLKAVAAKEKSRALKRKAEAQLAAEQPGSLECIRSVLPEQQRARILRAVR